MIGRSCLHSSHSTILSLDRKYEVDGAWITQFNAMHIKSRRKFINSALFPRPVKRFIQLPVWGAKKGSKASISNDK